MITLTRLARAGLAIVALLAASACDEWLTTPSQYNNVSVVAARRNGDPVPLVDLTLYTGDRQMGYGTTNAAGTFTFTRVPFGVYGVQVAEPPGYLAIGTVLGIPGGTSVAPLDVANDTLSPVHFTFVKIGPGAIAVHVAGQNGAPLAGVPLQLSRGAVSVANVATDGSGNVSFDPIGFGVYSVVVNPTVIGCAPNTAADSANTVRDDLIVEDASRDSVVFNLPNCVAMDRLPASTSSRWHAAGRFN